MKFSKWKLMLLTMGFFILVTGEGLAQNQWIDSILPADHLLENMPWMGDDGKIESKGLFDFEDVRGLDQKDLVLIYRQSVPLNEMDKPHNQTLIVCFYDKGLQKYVKNFEDEGGTIEWMKFIPGPDKKSLHLILQRDDLKGNQVLKGFAFLNGGMKQVLEAAAPQVYSKFDGSEILCSSKGSPKDAGDAEHVFSWDDAQSKYSEGKSNGAAGWSGFSIAVPVAVASVKPVVVAPAAVAETHPSKNGWWDEPFDANAASIKLKTELVPDLIKKGQVAVLGQKAKSLFAELEKRGTAPSEITGIRSSYYAAVASASLDNGDAKGAKYYLKLALQLQADNADAVALEEKIK